MTIFALTVTTSVSLLAPLLVLLVLAAVIGSTKPKTLTDSVVELFKAHPNTWLRERRIMQAGGWCGFRSRITDARKRGLDITNKTWRETGQDGITYTCSAYMYRPANLLEIAEQPDQETTCL